MLIIDNKYAYAKNENEMTEIILKDDYILHGFYKERKHAYLLFDLQNKLNHAIRKIDNFYMQSHFMGEGKNKGKIWYQHTFDNRYSVKYGSIENLKVVA